jgi:hypothetical protein
MKIRRQQIGPRVPEKTYESLKRMAATASCSISNYCEQVLTNHVEKESGRDEGPLRQFEQRFMEALAQTQAASDLAIKRLERNINAVKAMIDAHVEARDPQLLSTYRRIVADTLRTMGIQIQGTNGCAVNNRQEMRERLHEHLCHDLGEPVLDALTRAAVTDLELAEDGRLLINEGGSWMPDPNAYYSPEQRESIIGLVANSLHEEATFANPIIEGEVAIRNRRYRFTGHLPPICATPAVVIRKPAEVLYTLADYERDGIITRGQHKLLQRAVLDWKNILIAGGMGSGKSTLANALIDAIPPNQGRHGRGYIRAPSKTSVSAPAAYNQQYRPAPAG